MKTTYNTPYFSVVIPVHNKLPHLERTLNSVLKQTFQDFEIILIDDASSDGSTEKIQTFLNHRTRSYRRDLPGPGGYAGRNLGIEKANGTWVAFLDADDEWLPDHLENMHALSQQFSQVYFMGCGWQQKERHTVKTDSYTNTHSGSGNHLITVQDYLELSLSNRRPVWTSIACVKKTSEIAPELFPAESGAKRGGDLYAWLKLVCHHREMAWSEHIGGIYHLDSTNMVTKGAKASPQLMSKDNFTMLGTKLSAEEKRLLAKQMNKALKNSYFGSIKRHNEGFNVSEMVYWKGDFRNALKLWGIGLIPVSLMSKLFKIKAKI